MESILIVSGLLGSNKRHPRMRHSARGGIAPRFSVQHCRLWSTSISDKRLRFKLIGQKDVMKSLYQLACFRTGQPNMAGTGNSLRASLSSSSSAFLRRPLFFFSWL